MSDGVPRDIAYRIDEVDNICSVSEEWLEFARANGAPHLSADKIIGRRLWEFVTGREVAHLYRLLIGLVRSQRRAATVPFRCDSPEMRRYMELTISPVGGDIELRARLLREEKREPVHVLESTDARTEQLVTICSWCKRVQGGENEWYDLEDALTRMPLMSEAPYPQLTHGICPYCAERLHEVLGDDIG